jgi:two-component system sensor histidine kinase QseC
VGSIRTFLIAGILAILILFNFVAALRGYQSSMAEADILFDNELLDLSRLVANLDLQQLSNDFRMGNNLAFQIWQEKFQESALEKQLVGASFHAPDSPINMFSPGFDYANFDGYRWRTYTRYDELKKRWTIVAERTDLRFVLAENVVLESITPILFGIPLIGLLIWIVVSQGLKPLRQLSEELRSKPINDLSPITHYQAKNELNQVVRSLNGFIQRLDQALEREKRFSADAAHELRTPISALKIQLHNLQNEMDGKSESFLALQDGVDRMQHLIEQLLSLYRASPDQFASNCTELDIFAVTQDVIAQNYSLFEKKHQNIELNGKAELIIAERFALETLISNLLSNASKYSPDNSDIKVNISSTSDEVCLSVEDNGQGIPEDEKERIFERFYRSVQNEGSMVPGCGLGLTIVKHVVDLHGATLTLDNAATHNGSIFTVCFKRSSV